MSISIGIVGLANVGKSTLFNALVRGHQAKVADYPFTTIEPNVGMVEVPDNRLQQIANSLQLNKVIPATIKFIDIAGLVKNAHQGEGLGNQFLSHIREVDAIIHVLDGFSGKSDPAEAKEIVEIELELAEIKKPTLYVLNIKEEDLNDKISHHGELGNQKWVANAAPPAGGAECTSFDNKRASNMLYISAKMEEELIDLADKEQKEYLKSYGLNESGLVRLIKESYKLLNLITFYTLKLADSQRLTANSPHSAKATAGGQIQAWPILKGTKAPQAAGKVHTDMERGFIAAEVCAYEELIKYPSWIEAREKGKIRTEGKNYALQDGDVVHFKFNV